MRNRRDELLEHIADGYVLFSCEGTAEHIILTKLVDWDLIFIGHDKIIKDPDSDFWFTEKRSAKGITDSYLNEDYDHDVLVLSIKDQRGHPLRFSRAYEDRHHPVRSINIVTHPEIEMLVIYKENANEKFLRWSSSRRSRGKGRGLDVKPSTFCKEELHMPEVKTEKFLNCYWDNDVELTSALHSYQRNTSSKSQGDDFMLADLLK